MSGVQDAGSDSVARAALDDVRGRDSRPHWNEAEGFAVFFVAHSRLLVGDALKKASVGRTPMKACIKCNREMDVAVRICPHCHTYVGGAGERRNA